ncbi:unnamed protein product [Adineta steineri]|uniref:Uncharacterized protein n=1 Tax=Adineta steineri TaxID=433720 RepID=A0A814AB28_9BILA|nr:unnamed protein product [Adineta steineri]
MKSSTYIYSPENNSSQQQSTAAQHNKLSEEKFNLKHRRHYYRKEIIHRNINRRFNIKNASLTNISTT